MARLLVLLILVSTAGLYHPVHVSVSNIDMDPDSGKVSISIKLFSDDFETIVNRKYGAHLALKAQQDPGEEQKYIDRYVASTFNIWINDEKMEQLKLVKTQMNDVSIWLYYECEYRKKMRTVRISDVLMNDLYPDQTNLVIVTFEEHQKGYRLNNKNTEISFRI